MQTSAPAAPSDSSWKLYAKAGGIYARSSNAEVGPFGASSGSTVQVAHGCRATRASGNVSVGNNTYTVITFDAEDYDTDSMHDTSSNTSRITIPSISGVTTGLWSIKASGYTSTSTGRVDTMFRKNANASNSGGTLLGGSLQAFSSSGVGGFMASIDAVLSATDYVELFVRTTTESASVTYDANFSPLFEVAFLGKVT